MISGKVIGACLGLILGIVWMWLGFGPAIVTGLLAAIGWFLGSILSGAASGSVDLSEVWNALQGRRGT